jgi:polyhydroxybutyrate depolymerase
MRRLWQCAALLIAVLAALATAHGPVRAAAASAPGTSVCDRAAVPGSREIPVRSGGLDRMVRVYLPPGLPDGVLAPLVLNLHGSGSDAAEQELRTGMNSTARAHRFVVAYPQAHRRSGTGYAWNVPGTPLPAEPASHVDDLRYLRDVVSALVDAYCLDPQRVFATGFSGGARMSSSLACAAGTPLAAVAPVGGVRAPTPCRPGHPVGVVAFHGVADAVNLYAGHGQSYWTYSVPEAVERWGRADKCGHVEHSGYPVAGVTLTSYSGCAGGVRVLLYALAGVGHRWPRPVTSDRPVSVATAGALDVDELIWSFFAATVPD